MADVTADANPDLTVGVPIVGASGNQTTSTTQGGSFTKSGAGTMRVNAANTYTGSATVNGGTLQVGSPDQLPRIPVWLSMAPCVRRGNTSGVFDLNGVNQTLAPYGALSVAAEPRPSPIPSQRQPAR